MVEFSIQVKFPDHFGFSARIYVSSSMTTIDDLKKRVSELFEIDNNFYLTLYGDVLHPKETIKLIHPGAVVIARKGSFIPWENLPKKTCFEKLKGSCIKLIADVTESFFTMFEINTSNEDLFHMNQDAAADIEYRNLVAKLYVERELRDPYQEHLQNVMCNDGNVKKISELISLVAETLKNKEVRPLVDEASHYQNIEGDSSTDEDSDHSFIIMD